jgi:CheY-like chemotaxis protein
MAGILIIGPEDGVRDRLQPVMAGLGHQVSVAATSKDAIKYIRASCYDLAVIEIRDADQSGVATLRAANDAFQPGRVPILSILTSRQPQQMWEVAAVLSAGTDAIAREDVGLSGIMEIADQLIESPMPRPVKRGAA